MLGKGWLGWGAWKDGLKTAVRGFAPAGSLALGLKRDAFYRTWPAAQARFEPLVRDINKKALAFARAFLFIWRAWKDSNLRPPGS